MKNLAKAIGIMLFSLIAFTSFSQTITSSATSVFASYPASINCKEAELSNVFKAAAGQNINVVFAGTPFFSGVVTANITRHSNVQSIAVKIATMDNTTLTLSKRTDENNNTTYIGHIINTHNPDAYELKHLADGTYQFVKVELEKILPTCATH